MRKISKEDKQLLVGSQFKKYNLIYALLTGLIASFELVLFIRGLLVFSFSSISHYLYLSSYSILFVFSLITSILMFVGKKRNFSLKFYNVILRVYACAILIWSLIISYLDMNTGNPPLVYLTVIITIASVVVLDPLFFVSILTVSFMALIGLDAIDGFKYFISTSEFINNIVFISMAAIVGIRHFLVSFKDFKATEILEASVLEERNRVSAISLQTIMSIINTIDAKDKNTREHSQRVAEYSEAIAKNLNWDKAKVKDLHQIALLHDIGKIGIPDSILNCTGSLTKEEFETMKMHTVIGGDILKDLTILENVDLGAKYHHERYDGTGYPTGLKGEEIPLEARIIAIADAFDAMNSNRVYRKKLTAEKIKDELINGKGKQFDPTLIDVFMPYAEKILDTDNY
ncbi:MAG: HD-GYP domain-containing protein [Clostridia bacterium]|nr:HD-GYP domain-containing protein [Clostridia bacterium]